MFGNAEWPHIQAALRTHSRGFLLDRVAESDSVTTLPSGREFSTDRER